MQPNINGRMLLRWIAANALGLGVGFVAAIQTEMLFKFGFDWEKHWNWTGQAVDQDVFSYVITLVVLLVAGVILGSAQALILRGRLNTVAPWILATVAGFVVCAVIIDWPLIAVGVLGSIPGPVEPFILTVGGCALASVFQFMMLRKAGIHGSKWLLLWIIGLVAGVVLTGVVIMSFESFAISIGWPLELFVNGFFVGGVAALLSGKALFVALAERQEQSDNTPMVDNDAA